MEPRVTLNHRRPNTLAISILLVFSILILSIPMVNASSVLNLEYNHFNGTNVRWFTFDKNYSVPWQVRIDLSKLVFNATTSNPGAVIKIANASSGTLRDVQLIFFKSNLFDVVYECGSGSYKIATGHYTPSVIVSVSMTDNGLSVMNSSSYYTVQGYAMQTFSLLHIAAYGNGQWVATGGYVLLRGDIGAGQSLSEVIVQLIPIIVIVGILGAIIASLKKFR